MPAGPSRYSSELRERAVRMVAEVRPKYPSESAAISAVALELGIRSPDTLRRWIRQAAEAKVSENTAPTKSKLANSFLTFTNTIITAVLITILGGLGLLYSEHFLGNGRLVPHVELDRLSVSPGRIPSPRQIDGKLGPFSINIELINAGTQIAVVNDAKIVIERFVKLPDCAAQGAFPTTGSYGAFMPIKPRRGEVIYVPVSQLAPSNGADRFNIFLRLPGRSEHGSGTIYMYLIKVYVNYGTPNKLSDVGNVLVDLPFDPTSAGAYFWTKYFAAHPGYFGFEGRLAYGIERCLVRNSRILHSILSVSAMRTHGLSIIPSELSLCCVARRHEQ
jgi:hypothetical protein